ncbi:MAG: Cysteine desulfurase [Flavobacteriaceae bacterium]|nr:MAG: Cysteine desulfurase [Flavobacteriaceae bacterium]
MLCEETGAKIKVIPIDHNGELVFSEFEKLLNSRTELVFVNHVSNALGIINPIKK